MIFYFSGTGNSEYVARQLAEALGERLIGMAQAINSGEMHYTLGEGETVGWVFPTYAGGPAPIAVAFARKVEIEGFASHTYSYMVTTCGDDIALSAQMWRSEMAKRGMHCNMAMSVQMPNNYILLPGFDVDSKDLEVNKRNAAVPRIAQVVAAIESRSACDDVVRGSMPWLKSKVVYPMFRRYAMSDSGFASQKPLCNGCGKCVKVCPNANISLSSDGVPEWHGNCAMCLSCIHRCPMRAIQYGKQTQKKGRYHF